MMTANEVRESYKKFFEGKGHKIVPSAPMVIKDDPTLMFTNAGMNQWKDIILGTKDPGKDVRRVDSQKCLRVSGKHNDLEEVRAACVKALPRYWQPAHYQQIDQLPTTETGKIARAKALQMVDQPTDTE